jgi:hypothetical protein
MQSGRHKAQEVFVYSKKYLLSGDPDCGNQGHPIPNLVQLSLTLCTMLYLCPISSAGCRAAGIG